MELFERFIVTNYILLCVVVIMITMSIQNFRKHPKTSLYSILIMVAALTLAVSAVLEDYGKSIADPTFTLVFSVIGYALRPTCIYLFILLSGISTKNKWFFLTAMPLVINLIIYCLGFFPATRELVVYFRGGEEGSTSIAFTAGPLRYTSHIIAACYLAWLIYLSLRILRMKHLSHGIAILGAAIFVIGAVVIETFFNDGGDIQVLNATIAVGGLFYYLYLYIEKTQVDTLTGLYNRETYYVDAAKMERDITGVIQFDMNGLKFINDTFGHFEGDKALATVASKIAKASSRKMYAYRLGGDEFLLLATNCSEEEIKGTIEKFSAFIRETQYHCSLGYAYRTDASTSVHDLMIQAEAKMYEDKRTFYAASTVDRRKK